MINDETTTIITNRQKHIVIYPLFNKVRGKHLIVKSFNSAPYEKIDARLSEPLAIFSLLFDHHEPFEKFILNTTYKKILKIMTSLITILFSLVFICTYCLVAFDESLYLFNLYLPTYIPIISIPEFQKIKILLISGILFIISNYIRLSLKKQKIDKEKQLKIQKSTVIEEYENLVIQNSIELPPIMIQKLKENPYFNNPQKNIQYMNDHEVLLKVRDLLLKAYNIYEDTIIYQNNSTLKQISKSQEIFNNTMKEVNTILIKTIEKTDSLIETKNKLLVKNGKKESVIREDSTCGNFYWPE